MSLVCQLFGALVLAVNAALYFRWGDAGEHVEVWSSSYVIQSCVDELAMRGTGPDRTTILRHAETYSAFAVVLMVWGHAPKSVPCSFLRRLFLEEILRASSDSGFGR